MGGSLATGNMSGFSVDAVWMFLKWVYVLSFSIYVVFALVVVAQVRQMIAAFNGQIDSVLKLVAWLHFLLAVSALLMAIIIL